MDREKLFEDYKRKCIDHEEICGQGNPNADILIIGKEPHGDICKDREEYKKHLERNYDHCRVNCFVRKTCKNLDYYKQKYQDYNVDQKSFSELTTWKNYQTLLYEIYKGVKYHEEDKNIIDFERFAYTTELSSMPRPKADYDAAKDMINKRLLFFKESEFIQSFPVVVLACGPFIKNIGEGDERQIDNTFNACYDKEIKTNNGYKFYTHYNTQNTQLLKAGEKLIIHTRQLSNFRKGDGKQLIEAMAEIIHNHLHKLGLL